MTKQEAARANADLARVKERLRLLGVRDAAQTDPKALINEIRYFDPVTKEWVFFRMFPPEGWKSPVERQPNGDLQFDPTGADDWFWQSEIVDWLHDPEILAYLIYKARQLGITLICCAYALWLMLYEPGAACVGYSYEEGEAQKLTQAIWAMFESLPETLRNGIEVVTPSRGQLPTEWVRFRHPDGRISSFQALPATKKHGHGARVRFALSDEVAKQPYGREIYEAIIPATASRGGKFVGVSTADGVSNLETGEGNFFHHLYATKREKGLRYVFLPWNAEPTRGLDWYAQVAMLLPEAERNRQFPLTEREGFVLSGELYFDSQALQFYRDNIIPPKFAGQFVVEGRRKASFRRLDDGIIQVWQAPVEGHKYGLACDTSTGRAADYTSVDVIDFMTAQVVAHLHAKIESPRAAIQVHCLGKWYNTGKIMVERGGGYGESLIIALKDGTRLLPSYPNLYRHTRQTNARKPISEEVGFPMSPTTRPTVVERLKFWVQQRYVPFLSAGHVDELESFVHKETTPTPRAQDGSNDDRVMSLGMAVYLYERYGEAPLTRGAHKRRTTNKYQSGPVKAGG